MKISKKMEKETEILGSFKVCKSVRQEEKRTFGEDHKNKGFILSI